jgi:hypothetical protein
MSERGMRGAISGEKVPDVIGNVVVSTFVGQGRIIGSSE